MWEKKSGILHENEAAEILYKICAGNSSKVHGTEIKEGKIEVVSKIDGILKIRRDALVAVNSLEERMKRRKAATCAANSHTPSSSKP